MMYAVAMDVLILCENCVQEIKKMKVGNKREQGGGIRTTLPKRDRGVHVTASLMRVKLLLG